ncbi:MAG: FAD-dependent oxidoreductase [Desulfurivibrio sp.]|nr:FAD-dependent oxidoreductase [Desulfurivibrio sp.]
MKKVALLVMLAVLVVLFFFFDLDRLLTLETLKQGQERFTAWRTEAPWLVGGGFFLLYVVVTALSLPGAAVMTLAAGALFGLLTGTILVSFASTIGATLAFLVARFLLHDTVQQRFGDRLAALNRGIKRDGAFYLFTLRLVPIFPFFLINLVLALTPIRAFTFYWVSQVGMLPGTVVYINAGTQLAAIERAGDIMSPVLLGSFALLGIFPLLAKKIVAMAQQRRVYAGWRRPRRFDRNLVVIGAGAGGLVSAYIAAAVKAKVTLVEGHKMGGDCLNYGCVPSKSLIRSAKLAHQCQHADRYGLRPHSEVVDFPAVMRRLKTNIATIAPHDSVERYQGLGVEVLLGHGRLVDPWTVEVKLHEGGSRRLRTRHIIIAAGAEPAVPPLPGLEEVGYLTSDTLWEELAKLDRPPRRLLVLGGGPIGCELAQALARLGSRVTQVLRGPRLLPREDAEVAELARQALEESGVTVLTEHKPLRCVFQGTEKGLVVEHEGVEQTLPFDTLLLAAGRRARLRGYGLEELGVPVDGTVTVNDYLETRYPNILAVGDVAGPYQFTHTAAHMAWFATVNALFGQLRRFRVDYSVIPWCTFLDPEVARVGLNEQDAQKQGIAYELSRYELSELDRAVTDGAERGFVKVLTVPGKDKILGVTIVAAQAGELLAEYVLAMRHGLGLNKILGTIHPYPTMAEANKYAAGVWKKAHAPQKLLALFERYHAWRRKERWAGSGSED